MAHKRRARPLRRSLPDPVDVLEARVEARAEDLFDLIHQVNPTRQALSGVEKTRRYRLKTRLQSLLIRRFGESHLAVARESGEVVSLAHRAGLRDACHVPLSELDPEARSWVVYQLDLDESSSSEPELVPPEVGESSGEVTAGPVEGLLADARRAIQEYDFEGAETRLREALEVSGGAPGAAEPLLELLVEHLGMNTEALALEPRLSTAAREASAIRLLLALAAARLGESDRARGLIRGLDRSRAVEVHVALAEQAIRQRDRAEARRCLEAVVEGDPVHPRIQFLEEALGELRVEDLRSAEDDLRSRYAELGALAVEEQARDLGKRWPQSRLARRILREITREKRRAIAAEQLELGDRAFDEGRFEEAARRYSAAREAGSERPDLVGRLEDAERRARELDDARRLDALSQRFRDGTTRGALLSYLELPTRLRAVARERLGARILGWLDTLEARTSSSRPHAADAVLALERAAVALEDGDAEAAVRELGPHRKELKDLEAARRIFDEARAGVEMARRARVRDALRSADEALEAGDLDAAAARLSAVTSGELTVEEKQRADELRGRLEHGRTLELLSREVDRHVSSEDFLGARTYALRLRELARDDSERQVWDREIVELGRDLHRAWCLEVASGSGSPEELADIPPVTDVIEKPLIWLDDDGRQLLFAESHGFWLFLRRVDVERSVVTERVSLRVPVALGRLIWYSLEGEAVWLVGLQGGVVELACGDGWEIRRHLELDELLPDRQAARLVARSPGTSELAVELTPDSDEQGWSGQIVDLVDRRLGRELTNSWMLPILGLGAPRLALVNVLRGARLVTPQGAPVENGDLPLGGRLRSAAVAPDGQGLLLTDWREKLGGEEDAFLDHLIPSRARENGEGIFLVWAVPSETGGYEERSSYRLEGADTEGVHPIATSLERGLSFQLVETEHPRLVAWRRVGEALEEVYRVDAPAVLDLAQDREGRRIVAVCTGRRGLQIHALDENPPVFEPPAEPVPREAWPITEPPFDCEPDLLSSVTRGAMQEETGLLLNGLLGDTGTEQDLSSSWLLALHYLTLAETRNNEERDRLLLLIKRLEAKADRHAARYLCACMEGKLESWDRALDNLQKVRPERLPEEAHRQHYHHILGVAWLHAGRAEEARAAFEEASRLPGSCTLEPLLDLTRPQSGDEASGSIVQRLLATLDVADRSIAAGDLAAAREVLERPVILRAQELQTVARRAFIWLEEPAETPLERFWMRRSLALFVELRFAWSARRRQICLPGVSWDDERLDELYDRAVDWLEELVPWLTE